MAWEPFLAPRLKIERADRHISDLNTVFQKFIEREPYVAVVERDAHGDAIVLHASERLPNRLATIVGDAVHNLRTSLDHLAVDLVVLNKGEPDAVYFPFCKTAEDFEATIKKRHIDRAAPEVLDVIRSLKPYRGGDEVLRGIHDLDILDKHRLLVPIGYVGDVPGLMYTVDKPERNERHIFMHGRGGHHWRGALDDGAKLVTLPAGHNLQIGKKFKPEVLIAFAEGQPLEGQPIIPTLTQCSDFLKGLIKTFENLCLGA